MCKHDRRKKQGKYCKYKIVFKFLSDSDNSVRILSCGKIIFSTEHLNSIHEEDSQVETPFFPSQDSSTSRKGIILTQTWVSHSGLRFLLYVRRRAVFESGIWVRNQ
jgi:hypothetical protein